MTAMNFVFFALAETMADLPGFCWMDGALIMDLAPSTTGG